jgi:hypothetical protein
MEDAGVFYGHLVNFTVFCDILWIFGIIRGNFVYFPPFWYFVPGKIWQPCCNPRIILRKKSLPSSVDMAMNVFSADFRRQLVLFT